MKKLIALLLTLCLLCSFAFATVSAEDTDDSLYGFTPLNSVEDIAGALTPDEPSETLTAFISYYSVELYELIQTLSGSYDQPEEATDFAGHLANTVDYLSSQIEYNKTAVAAIDGLTETDIEMFVAHNAARGLDETVIDVQKDILPHVIDLTADFEQKLEVIQQPGFEGDMLQLYKINIALIACQAYTSEEYDDAAWNRYLDEYYDEDQSESLVQNGDVIYESSIGWDEESAVTETLDDESAKKLMLDLFVDSLDETSFIAYLYVDEDNVTPEQYAELLKVKAALGELTDTTTEYLTTAYASFADLAPAVDAMIASYVEPTQISLIDPPTEDENPKTGSAAAPFGAVLLMAAAAAVIAKSKRR